VRPPLIVLLCATMFAATWSGGAFPSLLPEIVRETALADWQLGLFAGAFGFARMLADVPAGLFVARRLSRALVAGPILLFGGTLIVAGAGSFATLFVGRATMGVGQALSMVGGLTAILQTAAARRLGVALASLEFSAMLGLLSGAGLVALLPRTLSWHAVVLLTAAPQILTFLALPAILARLPRHAAMPSATPTPARGSGENGTLVALACTAGCAFAVSYASVEQLVLPVRGSHEFGLDRAGIARIFMLMQACDVLALLPMGMLADRVGAVRVLAGVMLLIAAGSTLIGFAPLPGLVAGAVLFGFGMAGWMIPLGVLRRETPAARVAWRTALYRVGVDGGLFLGPFIGALVAGRHLAGVAVALVVISVALLRADRRQRTVGAEAVSTVRP
jgi:MFS transporter, DHA1 family, multidrug resistance protein